MIAKTNTTYEAYIFLNQGGVYTQLAFKDLTGLFTGSGTLRFQVVGNTLNLYVNGLLQASAMDSMLTTGLVGMRALQASLDEFNVM